MKGSLFSLFLCHILFLTSFASQSHNVHWRRHVSKRDRLARIGSWPPGSQAPPSAVIDTLSERRISAIIGASPATNANITAWLSTLGPDGKWPDSEINYATGCAGQRANWQAHEHWNRLLSMAGAWYGGLQVPDGFVKNDKLRSAISLGMDYWFGRDFTNSGCLINGGTASCPCDNPGNLLWDTNWFSNVILVPRSVSQISLLLGGTLTPQQANHVTFMQKRSYFTDVSFARTGANALDIARIGMDMALLTRNSTLLADAYARAHAQVVIQNAVSADGIRPDGAFGQHNGVTYNGNYGKDFSNDILGNELEAVGTEFAASTDSQAAFGTLFNGNRWMIFTNSLTGVLHWDYSAIGRFITFPVADPQASSSIHTNLSAVGELGRQWQSKPLTDFESNLSTNATNANAGGLQGNHMFYTSDYMIHRGPNYVSTLKMWSKRTKNGECLNSQNPFGFHLSDGATYTHVSGDEYEDTFAAWDWNLIPGITVDYGNTPLQCSNSGLSAVETFVGGVSDGTIGMAVMRYTNPVTKSLHFQKTWFFLDNDIHHVMISGLSSGSSAPVRSVLDQCRANGQVLVDGSASGSSKHSNPQTLWHGDVGYKFSGGQVSLSISVAQKTGDWTKIGTSTQPAVTINMFTAYLEHESPNSPVSYTVFPGTQADTFANKSANLHLQSVQNDAHISAVYDEDGVTFMATFWDASGGSVTFTPDPSSQPITMKVDGNSAVIYKLKTGEVTVSDPSQSLTTIHMTLSTGSVGPVTQQLTFIMPNGGLAGSSVTQRTQQ